jgi:DNA-directed RNA polymerase specialized sigma24 family protein
MFTEADHLAELGAQVDGATVLRAWARKWEAALRERELETLSVSEAATELGRHYSTVWRAVKSGRLANVGTTHRPLVRRCDLRGTNGPHT